MPVRRALMLILAGTLTVAGCGREDSSGEPDATAEPPGAGAGVGATGTDATGLPLARDSVAATGSHP